MATLLQSAPLTVDDVMHRLSLAQRIEALAIRAREAEIDHEEKESTIKSAEDARNNAEAAYLIAAHRLIAAAEADAMRKRKGDELLLYWLMLMDDEGEAQFRGAATTLGATVTDDDVTAFLRQRSDLISDFSDRTRITLRQTAEDARKEGLNNAEAMARVIETGRRLADTEAQRLALTEAQATFGAVQLLALQQQGYKTKIWVTVGDDRVRDTHVNCGNQGAVAMETPFANGLMYPGDPEGSPEEVCNCRCWMVGGAK